MAAGAMTAPQKSASTGGKRSRWKILYILFYLGGAFLAYRYSWNLGTTWLLVGALIFILLLMEPDWRKFSLFLFINVVIATVIASYLQPQFLNNEAFLAFVNQSSILGFLFGGFGASVIWSLVIGAMVALIITGVPLLLLSYAGAVHVLALHQQDGVSRREAMSYVMSLILGINLPYIIVEDGQAQLTKEAGVMGILGGPGKLIVKQGNVAVLERGGKITRIVNGGVTRLNPMERLRNVYKLLPYFVAKEFDHVLTRDRIPLTITMSIVFRVEPAAEVDKRTESRIAPDGEALTEKLNDGLFQVYEGTIRKLAIVSPPLSFAQREIKKCADQNPKCQDMEQTDWQSKAGSLPEAQLRDQILSHRFDELFELVDSAPGEKPAVRVQKRKIKEVEQAILDEVKPVRLGAGVLVLNVDIVKIIFPEGAERLLLDRWGAPLVQEIGVIRAEGDLEARLIGAIGAQEARLLEAQSEAEVRILEAQTEQEVVNLEAQVILIKARAEAQRRIMEGRSKAEAQASFFRFIVESLQVNGHPADPDLTKAILQQLAGTFAAVEDIETFVRVQSRLNRQSFFINQSNLAEAEIGE